MRKEEEWARVQESVDRLREAPHGEPLPGSVEEYQGIHMVFVRADDVAMVLDALKEAQYVKTVELLKARDDERRFVVEEIASETVDGDECWACRIRRINRDVSEVEE